MDVPLPPGYEELRGKLDQIVRKGAKIGIVINTIEDTTNYILVHFNKESLKEFVKEIISNSSNVSADIMEDNRTLVYNALADIIKNSDYYKIGKDINSYLGGLIYVKKNYEILFPKTEEIIEDLQRKVNKLYKNTDDFWYKVSKYVLMVMITKSAEWHRKLEKIENINYIILLIYHEGEIVRSKLKEIEKSSIKKIEEK